MFGTTNRYTGEIDREEDEFATFKTQHEIASRKLNEMTEKLECRG